MNWLTFREPFSAWTHCAWLLLSLPATVLLWRASGGDWLKRFSFLVFGCSLAVCYLGSTLYHGVRLPELQLDGLATLDAIGIYLLIAGTATPVALIVLRGRWRWGMLTVVWIAAVAGITLQLTSVPISRTLSTGIYLGMGWVIFLGYFELGRILSHRAIWPVLLGGVLYTTGAVLNFAHWPTRWLGALSAHDLFHLFVMAGSFSHFWFMLVVVGPFERLPRSAVSDETGRCGGEAGDLEVAGGSP